MAGILAHLGELDARGAAAETHYASLFAYCTRKLGYSEAEAYLRIRAARAAARYPRILTMIEREQIHVSAVARIGPHLKPDNYRSLLAKASRRTREELDRLIASLAPGVEARPVIRSLSVGCSKPAAGPPSTEASLFDRPAPMPDAPDQTWDKHPDSTGNAAESRIGDASDPGADDAFDPVVGERPEPPASAHTALPPLGRVLFRFVCSETLRSKFKRARDLLAHKYPRGMPEEIFDDALEALLDRKDPWRRAARARKRRKTAASA